MTITKYDWNQIETEFTAGYFLTDPETGRIYHKYPTHQELAEKFGCSIRTIQDKSASNKWSLKREILQNKIKETLTERKISGLLSESAKYDSLTLDKLTKMHRIIDRYLNKYNCLFNDELDNELEDVEVRMQELESATRALERLQIISRRTLGEPVTGLNDLTQEINQLNSSVNKSDDKFRKARIKQLTSKLNRKEELKAQIEAKRKKLEEIAQFNSEDDGTT